MLLPLVGLFLASLVIGTFGSLVLFIDPTTKLTLVNLALFILGGLVAGFFFLVSLDHLSFAATWSPHVVLVADLFCIAISGRLAVFAVQCLKFAKADPGTGFSPATNPREI